MIDNYDILKADNLRQMVAEFETEQQALQEKRAKNEQHRRECMEEMALRELEEIREERVARITNPEYERHLRQARYAPHFYSLITEYTDHVFENAWANLVRRYAVVYDAKNINKYPKATPLPRMQDIMDKYMPVWMTYKKLKALAAHCSKWRQQ